MDIASKVELYQSRTTASGESLVVHVVVVVVVVVMRFQSNHCVNRVYCVQEK